MADSRAGRTSNWLGIHRIAWYALGIALALLVLEHASHVLSALPYLLILACPVMHFFMHGKHGHGHGGGKNGGVANRHEDDS